MSGRGGEERRGGAAGAGLLAGMVLVGSAVSVALGVYGKVHEPTGRALLTLGFDDLLEMKVALSTATLALGLVQVATAARMFGRIGRGPAPRWVAGLHRLSGVTAVLVSLPVAFQCLWALGFGSYSARVLAHSLAGCLFYGVFVTKMLALRGRRLPAWAVPLLGGMLFTVLVAVWLTSAGWYLADEAL